VILNPSFPEADFQRLQKQRLAGIQREKAEPIAWPARHAELVYGKGHAYGNPFSGSGTEAGVSPLDRRRYAEVSRDLVQAQQRHAGSWSATPRWRRSSRKLERLFKDWQPGDVPKKSVAEVTLPSKRSVYLIDRPGAPQSIIVAAEWRQPKANPKKSPMRR